ncbi:MAG TPA: hypothetical protein VM260_16995 [Pirellula sp.]|nr:hypothetical protein [Pirellula sp.]
MHNNEAAKYDLLAIAQKSIQASRSAIAKLLDATPLDDLEANAQLGPILAELRTSEAILKRLSQRYDA